jgi:hypothetical protein
MGEACTISSTQPGMFAVPPGANLEGLLGRRVDLRAGDSVVLLAVCFLAGEEALAEEALAFLLVAAIMVGDAQQMGNFEINCTLFAPTACRL